MAFGRVRSEPDHSVAQIWVIVMAKQLGLESTMKSRGRPKQAEKDSRSLRVLQEDRLSSAKSLRLSALLLVAYRRTEDSFKIFFFHQLIHQTIIDDL